MSNLSLLVYLVIMLLYIISPFDLISENVVGIIGYIDDIVLLVVLLVSITNSFMRYYATL